MEQDPEPAEDWDIATVTNLQDLPMALAPDMDTARVVEWDMEGAPATDAGFIVMSCPLPLLYKIQALYRKKPVH
jgi:hypothetical protein